MMDDAALGVCLLFQNSFYLPTITSSAFVSFVSPSSIVFANRRRIPDLSSSTKSSGLFSLPAFTYAGCSTVSINRASRVSARFARSNASDFSTSDTGDDRKPSTDASEGVRPNLIWCQFSFFVFCFLGVSFCRFRFRFRFRFLLLTYPPPHIS